MTRSPSSPTMSIASISSTSTVTPKKTRRFSIVRLFSSNSSSSTPLSASSSSTTLNDANTPYRHSMSPKTSSSSSMDTMQTEIMRERRKSIAALTNSPRYSVSLDFRPASGRRPILGGRKESAVPQVEMNEKMREFDELLQTRKTSTIRISLTPSLLQDTY
ncbi:hypothetical protein K457DRAFT_136539 [Linnemannia elongata AG-77]|uniref:Uncharacterized protein n=1 Tax=Linnemannia elongata AG-77 TaxID=1314771 RepID=A0A197K093_9FUNG|nr:hypothetical protein K457DRAFT_136539 [Linnemannia elongata AG-77]